MHYQHLPFGVYRMRLTGPAAAVDALGAATVDVEGSTVDNLEYAAAHALCDAMDRSYDDLPEDWCPFTFAAPELSANEYRNPDGSQQWFVGVFATGHEYGGPEEGGWWFDTGVLQMQTAVQSFERAEQLRDELYERFPRDENYGIRINLEPHPQHYPAERPRYE